MKVEIEKLVPSWNAVVVRQDKVEEKVGSLYLPDKTREADKHAEMAGTVIRLGEMAFTFGTPGKPDHYEMKDRPKEGDRILYRKYAGGQFLEGADGELYRVIDHTDVIGILNQ